MGNYKYTSAELNAIRTITDPIAESVVEKLVVEWGIEKTDELFPRLGKELAHGKLPDFLTIYLNNNNHIPEWLDIEQLNKGRRIFADYGREIMLALITRSLPMCYVDAHGAKVLVTTTRLIDIPSNPKYERRLLETLQFVVNVCDGEGTGPEHLSWLTVRKLRLIHATIRRFIHEKMDWQTDVYGAPINQEDLLLTLGAFCLEVTKALERMGIYLNDEEKENWSHLWRFNGYLLGIEENYLPDSYQAFEEMSARIHEAQSSKSDSGIILVASCVDFMSGLLPFHLLDSFCYAVFKYINEEKYRDMMGLTKAHWLWDRIMPMLMKSTIGIDQHLIESSSFWQKVLRKVNRWIIHMVLKKITASQKYFYLPKHLK